MWGATSDAANLWASYKIKMNCLVDLQSEYPLVKIKT